MPPAAEEANIAKAREALEKKMTEIEAQQPAPAQPPAPAPVFANPSAPATPPPIVQRPPVATPPPPTVAAPAPPSSVQTAARTDADAAAQEQDIIKRAKPTPKPPPKAVFAPTTPALPSPEAPPSPIAPDKQQRLANLLRQYRADQITPEQYHTERAKIMAEP